MNITFISHHHQGFNPNTPTNKPLGGSESSICYLSSILSKNHQVTILNNTSSESNHRGVIVHPLTKNPDPILEKSDVVIIQNFSDHLQIIRSHTPKHIPIIFWNQHHINMPQIQSLLDVRRIKVVDHFVFVSKWQLQHYLDVYKLDKNKCRVIQNAVAPIFESQIKNKAVPTKTNPTIHLAYTSTPFRGLEILLHIFPKLLNKHPNLHLHIASSLSVYGANKAQDTKAFNHLYQLCIDHPNITYYSSVSQLKLAKILKNTHILTYPNTFLETSCITIMEAMASKNLVVSSAQGALPETSNGHNYLIPGNPLSPSYQKQFIDQTIKLINLLTKDPSQTKKILSKNRDYILKNHTYRISSKKWQKLLSSIVDHKQ